MRSNLLMICAVTAVLSAHGCKKKADEVSPASKATTAGKPEPTAPKEPAAMAAEALAARYDECWRLFNDRSWDAFGGCFAEKMVSTTQGVPGTQDRAAQVVGGKAFADAFADGKGETRFTLVDGRRVVGVTMFAGTQSGVLKDPSGDIPATGKKVGYLVAIDAQFDERNQISRMHEIFDMGTFMFQLGLSPGPGRALGAQVAPSGTVIAKGDDIEKQNVAAHVHAYELFNARAPTFNDYLAEDIIESANGDPEDVTGKAALMAKNSMMLKGFSDMKVTPDEAWGAGDYTVVRAHMRGTNDGAVEEMGLPKTGKAIDMGFLELIQWQDGKAKHVWVFMNTMEMAQQLGLMGDPAPEPDGK